MKEAKMRRMILVGMIVTATILIAASGSWAWTQVVVTRGYQGGPVNASQGWNVNHGSYHPGAYGRDQGVDEGIMRQESLILHGVARGQITPGEQRVLYGNLNRIRNAEARYYWDGRLTQAEYQSLDRMLDQNGRQIEQASYNYDGYGRYNR
jgi:hypothetical protein